MQDAATNGSIDAGVVLQLLGVAIVFAIDPSTELVLLALQLSDQNGVTEMCFVAEVRPREFRPVSLLSG